MSELNLEKKEKSLILQQTQHIINSINDDQAKISKNIVTLECSLNQHYPANTINHSSFIKECQRLRCHINLLAQYNTQLHLKNDSDLDGISTQINSIMLCAYTILQTSKNALFFLRNMEINKGYNSTFLRPFNYTLDVMRLSLNGIIDACKWIGRKCVAFKNYIVKLFRKQSSERNDNKLIQSPLQQSNNQMQENNYNLKDRLKINSTDFFKRPYAIYKDLEKKLIEIIEFSEKIYEISFFKLQPMNLQHDKMPAENKQTEIIIN